MFETIKKDGEATIISDDRFQVKITPKIYDDGYKLTKTIADNPLEIIEIREIRLPLSEKEVIREAKKLLRQSYDSVDLTHYNIQTI